MTIRVLIADDQELVRTGFAMILDNQPDIEVVAQADNGRDAVTKALHLRPDVCLLDIRMPELDGIEVTRQIAGPGVAEPLNVVIVTTFDLDEYVHGALQAGAKGFLLKDAGPQLLIEAIHAASNGDSLISPSITTRLLANMAVSVPRKSAASPSPVTLTEREGEVLKALAGGLTNQELSDTLYISLSTVKTHVASLMSKIGVRNRVEIAMWAYENNLT